MISSPCSLALTKVSVYGAEGFERLCRWVLESAPEYRAKIEKVWLWDEWLGNQGRRDADSRLLARDPVLVSV